MVFPVGYMPLLPWIPVGREERGGWRLHGEEEHGVVAG